MADLKNTRIPVIAGRATLTPDRVAGVLADVAAAVSTLAEALLSRVEGPERAAAEELALLALNLMNLARDLAWMERAWPAPDSTSPAGELPTA
jgi:hypothetical protein